MQDINLAYFFSITYFCLFSLIDKEDIVFKIIDEIKYALWQLGLKLLIKLNGIKIIYKK